MPFLNESEWVFISELIYNINSADNQTEMRQYILRQLQILIPYDMGDFYLSDISRDDYLFEPVGVNYGKEFELLYDQHYCQIDYIKKLFYLSRSLVFRDTDLLSDEERESTTFYLEYLKPMGMHFVASILLCQNERIIGNINLHRKIDSTNFSERDLFILKQLEPHLSLRLGSMINVKQPEETETDSHINSFKEIYGLSKRETEIIRLIATGYNNQAIADNLFISLDTVKKHLSKLFAKTGTCGRTQLVCLLFDASPKR